METHVFANCLVHQDRVLLCTVDAPYIVYRKGVAMSLGPRMRQSLVHHQLYWSLHVICWHHSWPKIVPMPVSIPLSHTSACVNAQVTIPLDLDNMPLGPDGFFIAYDYWRYRTATFAVYFLSITENTVLKGIKGQSGRKLSKTSWLCSSWHIHFAYIYNIYTNTIAHSFHMGHYEGFSMSRALYILNRPDM